MNGSIASTEGQRDDVLEVWLAFVGAGPTAPGLIGESGSSGAGAARARRPQKPRRGEVGQPAATTWGTVRAWEHPTARWGDRRARELAAWWTSVAQAAIRKVTEETGLQVEVDSLTGIHFDPPEPG